MESAQILARLKSLPLGEIRYYNRIGSTNAEAVTWAAQGAPHAAVIIADEQLQGRGRLGRSWFTPPQAALAFSVILRPVPGIRPASIGRYAGLGALAVSQALAGSLALPAQIKWPNDVLVNRKKLAGILAEAQWNGEQLEAIILGIGVNVLQAATPPAASLNYPATSVEAELGHPVDRLDLLAEVLHELLAWLAALERPDFMQAWESRLAFRDEWVQVGDGRQALAEGYLRGLNADGTLRMRDRSGQEIRLNHGELYPPDSLFSLRPVDSSPK